MAGAAQSRRYRTGTAVPKKTFYVTTPIYYANDVPHLGHAYTTVAADVIARFKRMMGYDVRFLTGTDEHGKKMQEAAEAKGAKSDADVQKFCDEVVPNFRNLWKRLEISNDDFIRTTEQRHRERVKKFWNHIRHRHPNDIYLSSYQGLYCTACEQFYTEKELEAGNSCPIHKRPVVQVSEQSYFFAMSRYMLPLLEHLEKNRHWIGPSERFNEVLSFVKGGLEDLSVSRSTFTWGIPVPGDEKHVIYVWIDALANYISALGWDPEQPGDLFRKYWANPDGEVLHLIGKDIIRFHTVYWPTILMSAGIPLPKTVFAHGWWSVEGQKMSKTLRNVVDPNRLVDLYGADIVRYYLLRATPFGQDGNFAHEDLINRVTAELSNGVGNLLARVLAVVEKKYESGLPPKPPSSSHDKIFPDVNDHYLLQQWTKYSGHMSELKFYEALAIILEVVTSLDGIVQREKPWGLDGAQPDTQRLIRFLLEGLKTIAVMLSPFMPVKMQEMWHQLGYEGHIADFRGGIGDLDLSLAPKSHRGEPLFPSKDKFAEIRETITAELKAATGQPEAKPAKAAEAGKKDKAAAPATPGIITIDDFMNVELRVATVVEAVKVEKSEKLLKLQVKIGDEQRQVVAGIAKSYSPEQLIGRQVVVVANLKPAKLMGMESNGMILAAETEEGLVLAGFDNPPKPGSRVK